MKETIIGDIHGRTIWKDILEKEQPDRMVFLGDYVSSHEGIGFQQQIDNFMEILEAKEEQSKKFVLLRGNHDLQHLGYWWADCSGLSRRVQDFMSQPDVRERFLTASQWVYELQVGTEKVVCSHAGISKVWMEQNNISTPSDINLEPPSPAFGFTPGSFFDRDGNSPCQPCTWIRPSALVNSVVPGYTQVVAHTPIKLLHRHNIKDTDNSIWFCDVLGNDEKEYLVIEDDNFMVKKLETIKNEEI